jgi:hypothetical protein
VAETPESAPGAPMEQQCGGLTIAKQSLNAALQQCPQSSQKR